MESISSNQPEPRAPRRVVTAPVSLPSVDPGRVRRNSGDVETLYVHPDVRIIAFSASGKSSPGNDNVVQPLPWSSQHERTIAVGLFRIYRAPGSVAFLNCGSALKPIMPKGQCWSIADSNSKFVLQIRRPNYWRIELPTSTEEDLEKARALRTVFDAVLQFEKTPCPFQRPFTVPLPAQPPEAPKRRVWAPVPQRSSVDYSKAVEVAALPAKILDDKSRCTLKLKSRTERVQVSHHEGDCADEHLTKQDWSTQAQPFGRAQPFEDQREVTGHGSSGVIRETAPQLSGPVHLTHAKRQEESPFPLSTVGPTTVPLRRSQSSTTLEWPATLTDHNENASRRLGDALATLVGTSGDETRIDVIEGSGTKVGDMKTKLRRRHTGFGTLRSAPSAPQLTLIASPPSKGIRRFNTTQVECEHRDTGRSSPTWSSDSFHSTQSWLSPITPSSPSAPVLQSDKKEETLSCPHDHIALPSKYARNSGVSGTPETPCTSSEPCSGPSSMDRTPTQSHPQYRQLSGEKHGREGVDAEYVPSNISSRLTETFAQDLAISTVCEQAVPERRAPSPLPSAGVPQGPTDLVTLAQTPRANLGVLPMLLIAKTCGFILRPPSYLITLMLRVAARITAGEWRGNAMGCDPTGQNIPVDWDYSDSELSYVEGSPAEWDPVKSQDLDHRLSLDGESYEDANQSWEVD